MTNKQTSQEETIHASKVGDIVEFKYDYERIGKVIRFFNHSFAGQRMVEIEYMDESGNVQRINEEVSRTWK